MRLTPLRIAFYLLCTGLSLHAQGTISPLPDNDGEKDKTSRFNLTITGGFDNTRYEYVSEKTDYITTTGESRGSETIGKEEMKVRNKGQQYHFDLQKVGLRLSYRLYRSLEVWAGIGVAHQKGEEKWDTTDRVSISFRNGSPSPYYEGGLAYGYRFTDKLFVKAMPGVLYTHFNEMSMELHHPEGTATLPDYSLKRSYLEWEVPVIVGYALGKVVPYVGVSYQDYLLTDKYRIRKNYDDEDVMLHITDRGHSLSKIHGIAGVQYFFARNIAVGFTATFSRNLSGVLSFNIGL